MINNTYTLNKNVDTDLLLSNGFVNTSKSYFYKRRLYEKSIVLNISVSKEDMFMNMEVYDEYLKQPYIPFYNRDMNKTNDVLKVVLDNFDKVAKELIKKGILE
jgi:hypothetical protein